LYMGVRGVTDLMVVPGLINLDFADIRTVMAEMGKAMMGTGEAEGENRAIRAAEAAINNPLLEDTSIAGARGLLINITGGEDMTLFEVDEAANRIGQELAENANLIFGTAIDENLNGKIRVSVVATGIDTESGTQEAPTHGPRLVAMGRGGAAVAVAMPQEDAIASQPEQANLRLVKIEAENAVQAAMPVIEINEVAPPPVVEPARPVMRNNLFTDGPISPPMPAMPSAAPRSSLFQKVTLWRRGGHHDVAPAAPEPRRAEPRMAPEADTHSVNEEADQMGLSIPTFLRKQTS